MALLDSEVIRIRGELGYNVMGLSAEPYIGITAIFNSVIQNYITSGATTSSSTPVAAAGTPTPQTLVVGSAAGIQVGCTIIVDVDSRQERATVQNVVGTSVTVMLSLAHTGTYPVTVEGGESMVRDALRALVDLTAAGVNGKPSAMAKIVASAGIKKVDEVEFFGGAGAMSQGADPMQQWMKLREYLREELAMLLGVERLNRRGGGGGVSPY